MTTTPTAPAGATAAGGYEDARRHREEAFAQGAGTWAHLVHERVWAAFAVDSEDGEGLAELRAKVMATAARLTQWAEDIDYRIQLGRHAAIDQLPHPAGLSSQQAPG